MSELSERQAQLLLRVVAGHVETGQPVASKRIADAEDVPWGPSTVRVELARLEELGLLQHPHTSAGRVPTDGGYRWYADHLMEAGLPAVRGPGIELDVMRREVDDAVRATSEQLSQITNLLAIVTAPPIASTTIHRVEVLLLQPNVAMVVVITSTGGVTKRLISYEERIDPGLVNWASSYLNEVLGGLAVGARMLHARLAGPELGAREREFVTTLAPAFLDLEDTAEDSLYVDGAARLFSEERFHELHQINDLVEMLERRVALLGVLRHALDESRVVLTIGSENERPELQRASVVAAGYGTAGRRLGAVSVVGPVRMDYAMAISSVRQAADELSRFVDELYSS